MEITNMIDKHIKWLEKFIELYETNKHLEWLDSIYEKFVTKNHYVYLSADELLYKLIDCSIYGNELPLDLNER